MEKTKQQSEASQTPREPFAIMASSELPIIDIDNNGCSDAARWKRKQPMLSSALEASVRLPRLFTFAHPVAAPNSIV